MKVLHRFRDFAGTGVPYCRGHLGHLEADGLFPRRLKLNPLAPKTGAIAWVREEVDRWVAERVAARERPHGRAQRHGADTQRLKVDRA